MMMIGKGLKKKIGMKAMPASAIMMRLRNAR
jgi:hypothetical protein